MTRGKAGSRWNEQLQRAHGQFPVLAGYPQAQALLDQLVSQPNRKIGDHQGHAQPSRELISSLPQSRLGSASGSADRESSRDSLLSLLDRFEQMEPQKGLLDVLGESASAIRPRKKWVGEEPMLKRKGRKLS